MEFIHCIDVPSESLTVCTLALCAGVFSFLSLSKQYLCCRNKFPFTVLSSSLWCWVHSTFFLNDRVSEFDGNGIQSAHFVSLGMYKVVFRWQCWNSFLKHKYAQEKNPRIYNFNGWQNSLLAMIDCHCSSKVNLLAITVYLKWQNVFHWLSKIDFVHKLLWWLWQTTPTTPFLLCN